MNKAEDSWIESILNKAQSMAGDLQPWPHYFESRAREFKAITNFYNISHSGASVLEIGCGNGFTSSLLAGLSQRVTAFDLPHKDPVSHSIGIETARKFIGMMGIKNVEVIGGSAEELPFDDESFDIVFSEYMLQYVNDKARAINEMRRVLKKGGVIITIVPNFMARLLAPIMQYRYLILRSICYLTRGFKKRYNTAEKSPSATGASKDGPSKQKTFSDYLLLRPDGAYKSFREEFICHMPWAWEKLFERNGLKVAQTFSTEVLPLMLIDIMGSTVRNFASKNRYDLNGVLGNLPFIKECGYSIGIVAKKI